MQATEFNVQPESYNLYVVEFQSGGDTVVLFLS